MNGNQYRKHKKRTLPTYKPLALFALGLLLILVALLLPGHALAHGPADGGASTDEINDLFMIIFWIALPVLLLVDGLILYAIISARKRHGLEGDPEQIEGHRALEITWTVLSFAIVIIVFIFAYRFMTTQYQAEADQEDTIPDLTVHVTGYLYSWDYDYYLNDGTNPGDDTGITTTRQLTIPADRNVLLEITSSDVQHSFWVPELSGKIDAVPGYTNTMWLNVDEPGFYEGNCAEYCGTLHWNMLIEVEVLPPDEFDMWLADQQAQAEAAGEPIGQDLTSELPEGDAAAGESLFNELGCNGCHGEQPGAGPALSTLREHAENAVEMGYESAEAHLRESILMPCAVEMEGYNCQVMPQNYGERLTAQELANIIAYLAAGTAE